MYEKGFPKIHMFPSFLFFGMMSRGLNIFRLKSYVLVCPRIFHGLSQARLVASHGHAPPGSSQVMHVSLEPRGPRGRLWNRWMKRASINSLSHCVASGSRWTAEPGAEDVEEVSEEPEASDASESSELDELDEVRTAVVAATSSAQPPSLPSACCRCIPPVDAEGISGEGGEGGGGEGGGGSPGGRR